MSRVGIIGDTHIPYEHPDYLEWCKSTFDQWDCDTYVHIGDLIDHHALSFHDSEPTLKGAYNELSHARESLRDWYNTFPELTLIKGNHDAIPARQVSKIGMDSDTWLKCLKDVYDMPDGWNVALEEKIDGVLYHHGYTANGTNGFRNDSIKRMCSTVSGHAHSNAGISATSGTDSLVWGMAVGCGIDVDSMAFAYGKHFLTKPIIACGIVLDGKHPYVEYML